MNNNSNNKTNLVIDINVVRKMSYQNAYDYTQRMQNGLSRLLDIPANRIPMNGVYVNNNSDYQYRTIQIHGNNLEHVPEHLITHDVCMSAVQVSDEAICNPIVRRFHTLKMWMLLADRYCDYNIIGLSDNVSGTTIGLTYEKYNIFCLMRNSRRFIQIAYTLTRREQFEAFLLGTRLQDTSSARLLCEDVLGIIAGYVSV